jgi:hypothetical protein
MTQSSEIFSSARLLIQGAREDIKNLDAEFERFFNSDPYTQAVERDPQTGHDIYKLKMTRQMPVMSSRNVARIATELRSALDQAGFAVALASGNTRLKNTYFPFAPTAEDLDRSIKGRCRDLPENFATFFRSFNAHRGGDDLLWAMNEVANGIKHRFIVPVGQGIGSGVVDNLACKGRVYEMPFPPRWDRAKNEMVICVVEHGAEVNYNFKLRFFVSFGDIEVIKRRNVIGTLSVFADKTESIVNAIEAEARRTGLIT